MTSDANSGKIPDSSLAHGSQATYLPGSPSARGKVVPPAGKVEPTRVAAANPSVDSQAYLEQLNKHFNESGRPDQFRLDASGKLIQQVNPATGAVIGEFAVSEFPALARSVGASGLLVDDLA
jgi:hypothetical protein